MGKIQKGHIWYAYFKKHGELREAITPIEGRGILFLLPPLNKNALQITLYVGMSYQCTKVYDNNSLKGKEKCWNYHDKYHKEH